MKDGEGEWGEGKEGDQSRVRERGEDVVRRERKTRENESERGEGKEGRERWKKKKK